MKLVSTNMFWRLMCCPGFTRSTRYTGTLGQKSYRVIIPPDDIPEFFEQKAKEAQTKLEYEAIQRGMK